MAIFLVTTNLPDQPARQLRDLLANAVGEKHIFDVAFNQWFVSADTTTEGLYKAIFPNGEEKDNTYGNVLIVSVSNYFGWHKNNLWEWLVLQKNRLSANGSANGGD